RIRILSGGVIRTLAPELALGITIDRQGTVFATSGHQVDGFVDSDHSIVAHALHSPSGIAAAPDGRIAVADGDRVVVLAPR
ncbi:MAG: hypothetical protein KGR26_08025, partial [Cyanobacteria bacterium REEB65]|nr:hypothetical protein [Cyanobacteria bacterium REEB65]